MKDMLPILSTKNEIDCGIINLQNDEETSSLN